MKRSQPRCRAEEHANCRPASIDLDACRLAAEMFRAMGDAGRLRILALLAQGERCVSEIAGIVEDSLPAVSQRLKLLRAERLVSSRRQGKHVFYALADRHIKELVSNAIAHAIEPKDRRPHGAGPGKTSRTSRGEASMSESSHTHADHDHKHGPACGHIAIEHEGHTDFLHDGHLHHQESDGSVVEHALPIDATNSDACTPNHSCGGHDAGHHHGPDCGHEAVPHGDHVDYLVSGHLHHPHGNHCDDHGPVKVVQA